MNLNYDHRVIQQTPLDQHPHSLSFKIVLTVETIDTHALVVARQRWPADTDIAYLLGG